MFSVFSGSDCSPSQSIPIPRGRSIPRTPLIDCKVEILSGSEPETDKNENDTKMENLIPQGNTIPRTPLSNNN